MDLAEVAKSVPVMANVFSYTRDSDDPFPYKISPFMSDRLE